MKLQNSLVFLSFILFLSCSNVNIENENKTMMEGLKEKEISKVYRIGIAFKGKNVKVKYEIV